MFLSVVMMGKHHFISNVDGVVSLVTLMCLWVVPEHAINVTNGKKHYNY